MTLLNRLFTESKNLRLEIMLNELQVVSARNIHPLKRKGLLKIPVSKISFLK